MPLLKGKENIGHNVNEMKKSGHPVKQAIAAALHTALDSEEDGEEGTMNHDGPEILSTTAMSVADINKKNESYWNGENGNLGPAPAHEESTPKLGQGKVAVYNPHAADEVAPTQSSPPDTRSDNLLERPGGIPGIGDGVVSGYRAGKAAGEELAEGGVGDDLAEGAEHMEPGDEGRDSVPGLSKWSAHAGGTTGGGKHGYTHTLPDGEEGKPSSNTQYSISPTTSSSGRPTGYHVGAWSPKAGHAHKSLGQTRTPHEGVKLAQAHHKEHFEKE